MRRWLTIIFGISLFLALCGCVAEVRPDGYYHRGYYREYPRQRYYYYDYDYPSGSSFYFQYRAR
jgi:hypothetical protein